MAGKSPDAFRTISEVADWLDRPAHVLRFWESKFTQVKPVKCAGGRRYYRPEDMLLLGGIKKLLHDDGMTIKGAQKIIREQGVRYVSALSQPLDDDGATPLEMTGATATVTKTDTAPEVRGITPEVRLVTPEADVAAKPPPAPPVTEPHNPQADEHSAEPAQRSAVFDAKDTPPSAASNNPVEAPDVPEPDRVAPSAPHSGDQPTPSIAPTTNTPLGADIPHLPDLDSLQPVPGLLAQIAALHRPVPASRRAAFLPILASIDALGARMGVARKG